MLFVSVGMSFMSLSYSVLNIPTFAETFVIYIELALQLDQLRFETELLPTYQLLIIPYLSR